LKLKHDKKRRKKWVAVDTLGKELIDDAESTFGEIFIDSS
jgi:hypothetical protein